MNSFTNYLMEANLSLFIFIVVYLLTLKKETNFSLKRFFLLAGILASVIFPLFTLRLIHSPLSPLLEMVPSYLLPEVIVGSTSGHSNDFFPNSVTTSLTNTIYLGGVLFFALLFSVRLFKLIKVIAGTNVSYRVNGFFIVESNESKPTFSFFHFIFIGQADRLSSQDKEQILAHEIAHAQQGHSLDIVLIHLLEIIFWFNPLVQIYKKTLVQLHEFEADAHTIKNHDRNAYCSLLAKVALQSNGYPIANHFNHSLTLKRIDMMQASKTNIKSWKIAMVMMLFPILFVLVSCQNKLIDDVKDTANSSAITLDIPAEVQKKLDELKATYPTKKFIVIEPTTEKGKIALDQLDQKKIASLNVIPSTADGRSFIIVEQNNETISFSEKASTERIYTVVDQQPEYPGGISELTTFISSHLSYPETASKNRVEGTVFVSFIVSKEGTVSDVQIIKGLSKECDEEAARVIKTMPEWIPGQLNGEKVNVRFVIPIKFRLPG